MSGLFVCVASDYAYDSGDSGGSEFHHDKGVEQLRASKSKIKCLTSLKHLCIEIISSKINYFKGKQDPFLPLAEPVMNELVTFMIHNNCNRFTSCEILPLFITPNNPYLYFNLTIDWNKKKKEAWTKESMTDAFNCIATKCGGSLRVLHLVMETPEPEDDEEYPLPSLTAYKTLLASLTNVKELNLHSCMVGKELVAVIASNCTKLEILILSENSGVNDECIDLLCKGECKLLSSLQLGQDESQVTEEGVLNALLNLKHLTELVHPRALSSALVTLSKISPDTTLELEEVLLDDRNVNLKTMNHYKQVFKMLPNIKRFCVGNFPRAEPFLQLTNITGMSFTSSGLTKRKIFPIITQFGSNLTSLFLYTSNCKVDPALIGTVCPNLKRLHWGCQSPMRSTIKVNENHFAKLEELIIELDSWIMLRGDINSKFFPETVLCAMLSSRVLQSVSVVAVSSFNRALYMLLDKVERSPDLGILSQLETFKLVECPIFMLWKMVQFVCLTPRLKVFKLGRCHPVNEEVIALDEFMKRHMPKVKRELLNFQGKPYLNSDGESMSDSDIEESMDEDD